MKSAHSLTLHCIHFITSFVYNSMNSQHEFSEHDFETNAVTLQHYMSAADRNCRSKSFTHTDSQLITRKLDLYSDYEVRKTL